MIEVFQQVDAPGLVRRGLRHLLDGVRVVARSSPGLPLPFVTVVGAGTPGASRGVASENVHVTVYARSEPEARELALIIDGLLLSESIDWQCVVSPGGGLVTSPDEVSGGFMAAVTVVVGSPKIGREL